MSVCTRHEILVKFPKILLSGHQININRVWYFSYFEIMNGFIRNFYRETLGEFPNEPLISIISKKYQIYFILNSMTLAEIIPKMEASKEKIASLNLFEIAQ